MWNRAVGLLSDADLQGLFNDAWAEFNATPPVGIDLIAEASLRSMIATRIMRAAEMGKVDRVTLKSCALRGL